MHRPQFPHWLACKHYPVNGSNVCFSHGGNAPQVKRKARERIENVADRMARKLPEMASDTTVSEAVRLAAIRDALDHAGLIAPRTLDLSTTGRHGLIVSSFCRVSAENVVITVGRNRSSRPRSSSNVYLTVF